MAIYLRSCDSILVSYNDVLGKPMVSFGLVMCCCGWVGGQNTIGGLKYYDSILTPRSKCYIVFWPGVILPRGQNTIPHRPVWLPHLACYVHTEQFLQPDQNSPNRRGLCVPLSWIFRWPYFTLRMKIIKSDIINDSIILHDFNDLRSKMLFVWQ